MPPLSCCTLDARGLMLRVVCACVPNPRGRPSGIRNPARNARLEQTYQGNDSAKPHQVLLENEGAATPQRQFGREPPPVLVHQDVRSNLLMSSAGASDGRDHAAWDLDALVDWESACAFDASAMAADSMPLLEALASVVKGAWVAERIAQSEAAGRSPRGGNFQPAAAAEGPAGAALALAAPRCEIRRIGTAYERGRRHLLAVGVAVVPFAECFRTLGPPVAVGLAGDGAPVFAPWLYAGTLAVLAVAYAALRVSGLV